MNDHRLNVLEEYINDLQADRPSAVFLQLKDDKELAVVLRTAKTVHLLTRRPGVNTDFTETLERRLMVQAEDHAHVGRQRMRWSFALPGVAIVGVGAILVWQLMIPGGEAQRGDAVAEVETPSTDTTSRPVFVDSAALLNEGGESAADSTDVWEELEVLNIQMDKDISGISDTMQAIDDVFSGRTYGSAQVELTTISY